MFHDEYARKNNINVTSSCFELPNNIVNYAHNTVCVTILGMPVVNDVQCN